MKAFVAIAILALSSTAWSSDLALSCKSKDPRRGLETEISILSNSQIKIYEKQSYSGIDDPTVIKVRTMELVLDLLGKSNLSMKGGNLKGQDPIYVFVDLKNPGVSYLNTPVQMDPNGVLVAYTNNRGGREVICSEGPAFPRLQSLLNTAKWVSREEVIDYWDSSHAMNCVDDQGEAYRLRAFDFQYGKSSIQFSDSKKQIFSGDDVSQNSSEITFADNNPTPSTPDGNQSTITISLKPETKDGKDLYALALAPKDQPSKTLSCEAKWGFQYILTAIEQKKTLATSFPTPAGTMAQIDESLCLNGEAYKDIMNRYSDLIMTVPHVVGNGLGKFTVDKSPIGKECYNIAIFVKKGYSIEDVKSVIGETLEGRLIVYESMGPVILQ